MYYNVTKEEGRRYMWLNMVRELALVLVFGIGVLSYVLAWRYFREGLLEPYMDEEFHVSQARLYCMGRFGA